MQAVRTRRIPTVIRSWRPLQSTALAGSSARPAAGSFEAVLSVLSLKATRIAAYSPRPQTTVVPKVYRLDFNRNTGELRMVDNILAEVRAFAPVGRFDLTCSPYQTQVPDTTIGGRRSVSTAADPNIVNAVEPSPAWPPILAITSVEWNPAIRRCAMLASGMACGLVRIDWLEGPSVVDWERKEGFRTAEGEEVKDEEDE